MAQIKKIFSKCRFAFELAVLLILAVYVTVQAGGLGSTTAAPKNISLASTTSTVPGLLNYQGYLTDDSGSPLDGTYAIKFTIYDAPTDGTELWSETQMAVEVNEGRLSAKLGESTHISSTLFATYPDTFIGVTVGSDPEMTPRQRIHSVPYAMHADDGVPAGMVDAYAGETPPAGWLVCDGREVSRADYPGLFAAIGTTHGEGDGITTFNLPDYRGRFLRGVDDGVGRDPDADSRAAANTGGNTGDAVGSVQEDMLKSHSHSYTYRRGDKERAPYDHGEDFWHDTSGRNTGSTGGNETRPKNAYVVWLIT
jgi:hypothetical protein